MSTIENKFRTILNLLQNPKNLEENTGRTPTGLAYRQDAFDSDSEDKYSLRELCPNVTEKAILPLEENIEGW